MVELISRDGAPCFCPRDAAMLSGLLSETLADSAESDDSAESGLVRIGPLPFSADTITAGIKYCAHYVSAACRVSAAWSHQFINGFTVSNSESPLELLKFADFMDIRPLLEACCAREATRISRLGVDELSDFYRVDDFSTAEERDLFSSLGS